MLSFTNRLLPVYSTSMFRGFFYSSRHLSCLKSLTFLPLHALLFLYKAVCIFHIFLKLKYKSKQFCIASFVAVLKLFQHCFPLQYWHLDWNLPAVAKCLFFGIVPSEHCFHHSITAHENNWKVVPAVTVVFVL